MRLLGGDPGYGFCLYSVHYWFSCEAQLPADTLGQWKIDEEEHSDTQLLYGMSELMMPNRHRARLGTSTHFLPGHKNINVTGQHKVLVQSFCIPPGRRQSGC